MYKIIIVDDHKLVRDCMKALFNPKPDFEVVGEAANGLELIQLLPDLEADVVLMDINMEGMDGIDTTAHLATHYPDLKVLAFSMLNDLGFAREMLNAGAYGFVSKSNSWQDVSEAIKTVAAGERYFKEKEFAVQPAGNSPIFTRSSRTGEPAVQLSNRELEVLQLIAEGLNTEEIADKLFNSKRTIETHRQNILNKTRCRNTPALIKYAYMHQLIS